MSEIWTYWVTWNESSNLQIPDRSSVSLMIRRSDNTGKDGSMYKILSATFETLCGFKTWGSGQWVIGSYGTTGTIGENTSTHNVSNVSFSANASILNVGASAVSTYLTRGSNSGQTIFVYGSTGASPAFKIYVEVEEKYSASTISGGDAEFGSSSRVTISNQYIAELNHKVRWTIGNQSSGWKSVGANVSSASFEIPSTSAWLSQCANSTSTSGTIEVNTYKGSTQIGSTYSKLFTAIVPSSVKPSIGSITCTIKDPNVGIPGTYIQNTTGVYIQLNNVSPGAGATINAVSDNFPISANVEETYVFDTANYRYTVNRLANGGEITFSVSVIDSRGRRSDTVTATISVMEYALPAITAATAYRCRQNGIADEEGTYAAIRIVASYTSGSGNTMVINSTYYRSDTPESQITAQSNMTSGETYIIGNGNLDPSYAYLIRFTVTDSLGNNVIKNVNVQSSSYAIHVKNGGTGVAFGKTSEIANSVEINEGWDLYYRGVKVVPVIFSQQQPSNPFDGLVWLEPKS